MNKLKPQSPDPHLRLPEDMTLAKFGHLNAIITELTGTQANVTSVQQAIAALTAALTALTAADVAYDPTASGMTATDIQAAIDELEAAIDAIPVVTPPTYKVYSALLTQSGTDAPVATVLEDTIGLTYPLIWTRPYTGVYAVSSYQAFLNENKLAILIGNKEYSLSPALVEQKDVRVRRDDADTIHVSTINTGVYADNVLQNFFIEIRVYN